MTESVVVRVEQIIEYLESLESWVSLLADALEETLKNGAVNAATTELVEALKELEAALKPHSGKDVRLPTHKPNPLIVGGNCLVPG